MGYEDTIARVSQLQQQLGTPQAGGALPAAPNSAESAAFQQMMASQQQAMLEALAQDPNAEGADAQQDTPSDAMAQFGLPVIQAPSMASYQAMDAQGLPWQASIGGTSGIGPYGSALGMDGTYAAGGIAQSGPARNISGDLDGLDPQLKSKLNQLGQQLGTKIDVISGHRSYDEQAKLYQAYLNGTGNLAAPPGQSNHNDGKAADAYVNGVALANVPGAAQKAQQLGLHFPVGGEAWHVEVRH